jgi:glycine hydroxymethyltransferase
MPAEMIEVGRLIAQVLRDPASEANREAVRERVRALTARFPLYAWKAAAARA